MEEEKGPLLKWPLLRREAGSAAEAEALKFSMLEEDQRARTEEEGTLVRKQVLEV